MAKKVVINEEDFPSNSKVAPMRESRREIREEGALVEAPRRSRGVRRHAVVKKKTFTQSIASMLLGGSEEVGSYLMRDVLIPAAKSTIQEMITSGIEMLLFGEVTGRRTRDRDKGTKVSYGSYFKGRRDEDERRPRRSPRDKFDLNDIYFRNGDEADEVLSELCDRLEEYEEVTVADYFDAADLEGATWAHQKWGWRNLSKAYCTHTRQGWAIILPDPIELD